MMAAHCSVSDAHLLWRPTVLDHFDFTSCQKLEMVIAMGGNVSIYHFHG